MTILTVRVRESLFVQRATRAPRRCSRQRRTRRTCVSEATPTSSSATQRKKRTAVVSEVASFAPATVANFGPGFDWLGCAVQGDGDVVIARAREEPGVEIESIEGDQGRLTLHPDNNCVGVAASETLKMIGAEHGVSLTLKKGLPLGSGLGSSAASAAASAHAVNSLFGNPLSKEELVLPGLKAEGVVSGYHADNVAPALLGGFVMIQSTDPLKLERLVCPVKLCFVLVTPQFEAPTSKMRAVLPENVTMKHFIHNSCMSGLMVSGILSGDAAKIGAALNAEAVIEPVRGPLIPGFTAVKEAATATGAFGCTISGAGPTILAVVEDASSGEAVMESMCFAFKTTGRLHIQKAQIVHMDMEGARNVHTQTV